MNRSPLPALCSLAALLLSQLACNTLFPPKPAIEWDTSAEALILRASVSGGLVPQNFVLNAVPDAQVWGDGRIVWVEYTGEGGRRVLEGYLTEAQLESFLRRAVNDGFFGWENYYSNPDVIGPPTRWAYRSAKRWPVCGWRARRWSWRGAR
jgi:hypothetical protein